jgi:putative transposase
MSMCLLYALQGTPQPTIVNYLKGKSARRILQRFPELKSKATRGRLWSRSYFVATVGNVTADIVKRYVEERWEKGEVRRNEHSRAL